MLRTPEAAYSTDGGFKQLALGSDLGHASESVLPDCDSGRIDDRRWLGLVLSGCLGWSD